MTTQTLSRPATTPRKDAALVARMADFLLRHGAGDGSVTRAELLLDFSETEIDTHLEAAKALARKAGKGRS